MTFWGASPVMAITQVPKLDKLIKPLQQIGVYGGVLRIYMRSNADHYAILRVVGNQVMTRWRMDFNGNEPNLAESWHIGQDAEEFMFYCVREPSSSVVSFLRLTT